MNGWRVLRFSPVGLLLQTLPMGSDITSLTNLELDKYESCMNGQIEGLASSLRWQHRDIIFVQYTLDDVNWFGLYRGLIIEKPSSLSVVRGVYSLSGLIEKTKDVTVRIPVIQKPLEVVPANGTDRPRVSTKRPYMSAFYVMQALIADMQASQQLLNIVLGYVNQLPDDVLVAQVFRPNLNSFFDAVDQLLKLVPGYVQGVDAFGVHFVKKVVTTQTAAVGDYLLLREGDNCLVEPTSSQSQTIVTRVSWVVGWSTDKGRVLDEVIGSSLPVLYTAESGVDVYGVCNVTKTADSTTPNFQRIELPLTSYRLDAGHTQITRPGAVEPEPQWEVLMDDDKLTNLFLTSNNSPGPDIVVNLRVPASSKPVGFMFKSVNNDKFVWSVRAAGDSTPATPSAAPLSGYVLFPPIQGNPAELDIAVAFTRDSAVAAVSGAGGTTYPYASVRIIEFYAVAVDDRKLGAASFGFFTRATDDSGSARSRDVLAVTQFSKLTLRDGSERVLSNASISYNITSELYLTTDVKFGDRFDVSDRVAAALIARRDNKTSNTVAQNVAVQREGT